MNASFTYILVDSVKCKPFIHCLNIKPGPREDKSPLPKSLLYENNTYWIVQEQLGWYDAWKECKLKGSDLASIHSASDQAFLEKIVKNDGFPLWIGLSSHNVSFAVLFQYIQLAL